MSNSIPIGKTTEFTDGAMKEVKVQGREILLARVGGNYYVANNRCPHMGGNLSQGKLEGTVVTCPRHGSQFDLRDGHVVRWLNTSGLVLTVSKLLKPPRPLQVYSVKVEGDTILIEI